MNILLRDRHSRPLKKLRISVTVDSALSNLGKGIVKANRGRETYFHELVAKMRGHIYCSPV